MNILQQIEDCNQTYLHGVATRKEIAAAVSKISQAHYTELVKYYAYSYLLKLRSHNHNAAFKAREALLQARASGNVLAKQAQDELTQLQNGFMRLSRQDNENFGELLRLFSDYYAGTPAAEQANAAREQLSKSWFTNFVDLSKSLWHYVLSHPLQTGFIIFSAGITAAVARQPTAKNISILGDLQKTNFAPPGFNASNLPVIATVVESKDSLINNKFENHRQEVKTVIQQLVTNGIQTQDFPAQLAASPKGLEAQLQKSNQGDALSSEEIADYCMTEVNDNHINPTAMATFFYARALQQSEANNPIVLNKLVNAIYLRLAGIGKQKLVPVKTSFNPKLLSTYEENYIETQNLYKQMRALLSDDSTILSLDKYIDTLPSPEQLRKQGIALPPKFDAAKAQLFSAMSYSKLALNDLTEEDILLHTIPMKDIDEEPLSFDEKSIKRFHAWLSSSKWHERALRQKYYRQAIKGNITAMLKLVMLVEEDSKDNRLSHQEAAGMMDDWLWHAMHHGSIHACHLYFWKQRMISRPARLETEPWQENFFKHIASRHYPTGSWLLALIANSTSEYDFFLNQTGFQRDLLTETKVTKQTRSYIKDLIRIAMFYFVLTTRGLKHALSFIAIEFIGSFLDYQLSARLLNVIYLTYVYTIQPHSANLQNQPRIPIASRRAPASRQLAIVELTDKQLETKVEFLNELLNEQVDRALLWTLSRNLKQFILNIEGNSVEFKDSPKHSSIFPMKKFLDPLKEVLATFINGLNPDDLSIPWATNQGEWPNIADLKQALHTKLIALQQSIVAEDLQQVQNNCNTALRTCELDLSAQENLERERLWRRVAGYHELLMTTNGNEETKESVKYLRTRITAIEHLVQETTEKRNLLRQIGPVTVDNIEKTRFLAAALIENCKAIGKNTQSIETSFSKLPNEDDLFPSKEHAPQKIVAVQPATKPVTKQRKTGVSTFFKESPAPKTMSETKAAVKPSERFTKRRDAKVFAPRPATIATVTVQDHSAHIWSLLSNDNPYREQKSLLYRGLYYHTLRMLCALSEDNTDRARRDICKDLFEALSHGYFIALRQPELLVEFCCELTEPKSYKILDAECIKSTGLYQAYSRETGFKSVNYLPSPFERLQHLQFELALLNDCNQVFLAEKQPKFATHYQSAAKGCLSLIGECSARFFEISLSHRVILMWHTLENYNLKPTKKSNLDQLKSCCQFLLENIKLVIRFVTDVNFYALKIQLTKICRALDENAIDDLIPMLDKLKQTLERMTEANEHLPCLIRTVHAIDACRYRVRNKTKHKIDLVSLELYARENLTVAIDEISDQQVLGLTRITCLEVQIPLYIDLISANFAPLVVAEAESDSLRRV